MIESIDSIKKYLGELATVLNAFKLEAVQLRVLDYVLNQPPLGGTVVRTGPNSYIRKTPRNARRVPQNSGGGNFRKAKKAPTGTGAPATLTQLLAGTFFDKPRTINDLIEHCKHNLARTFKANEFSGKLGRMVRDGELTRKKNTDKQYEYKKP